MYTDSTQRDILQFNTLDLFLTKWDGIVRQGCKIKYPICKLKCQHGLKFFTVAGLFNCDVAHGCSNKIKSSNIYFSNWVWSFYWEEKKKKSNWEGTSDTVLQLQNIFQDNVFSLWTKPEAEMGYKVNLNNTYCSFMSTFNYSLSAYRVVCWHHNIKYSDFSQTFRAIQGMIMESSIQVIE